MKLIIFLSSVDLSISQKGELKFPTDILGF